MRGVLTGRYLSPVQESALEMLLLLNSRDRVEDFVNQVRASLVAGRLDQLPAIFPEWYAKDPDLDHPEEVEWTVPETPDQIAAVEEFIRTHAAGTISAVDLEGGAWE